MHPEDFLSLEEWHRLLAASPTPRETALLWLMAGCGLRVSEVAALKAEHVDSAGGYLHVVNGKGGKQRTCIIPRPALDALSAYLQGRESGYVFEGRHQGHISTRQIQRLLDEIAEEAGLQETRPGKARQRKKVTPHLLRHSFSRWTLDVGIDIAYLQQQLGHASLSTTAIYLKARPNHRRRAYERAGFDEMLKPRIGDSIP
ncbi:MAG: tyrosine-type recombinase/integrase [Methanotrichaceae archaeon]|nr:tyrosine-type recombinase/integrase [Methanotrichaceae archaeon]